MIRLRPLWQEKENNSFGGGCKRAGAKRLAGITDYALSPTLTPVEFQSLVFRLVISAYPVHHVDNAPNHDQYHAENHN